MKKLKKMLSKTKASIKKLYLTANDVLFNKLPASIGTPLAALLVVAPVLLAVISYQAGQTKHPSDYTVMITNLDGTRGGSGVIINNSASESVVLTNDHVCKGALKKGGKIRLVSGEEHLVTGYLSASEHDLCVLTVAADLKNSIKIANSAPAPYTPATVTGHPSLMPNVITGGHFGGRQIIPVMVGVKKCTVEDLKNPDLSFLCLFFGVVPVISFFESQVVTATIMPGSSGSAVLNSKNELSGLVFAGNAEGLSYAYVVPYEAIRRFLDTEALKLIRNGEKKRPWEGSSNVSENELEEEMSLHDAREIIEQGCSSGSNKDRRIKEFCQDALKSIRM
jgi:S1-C subfamily serine protease